MKLANRISLIGLTCVCLLSLHAQASAKDQTHRTMIWQKVALVPFAITPRAYEGTPPRPNQNDILQRLSKEATTRAERLLLKRRVAATIERVTSAQASTSPVFVTGTVTLPIALPRGLIGWRASTRKGPFATARVSITDTAGSILAQEEVTLNWDDVRWLQGGRARRNISLDDVLLKFTRKAVDRAVEMLVRQEVVLRAP